MAQPSIALTSLAIRNFRGIEALDLDFRRPDGVPNSLVVLAGPNGSGKTAVLEAALIASGGEALATGGKGIKAIRYGAADFSIAALFATPSGNRGSFVSAHASDWDITYIPYWYFSSRRAPELVGPIEVSIGRNGTGQHENDSHRLKDIKRSLVDAAAFKDFQSRKKTMKPTHYEEWMNRINAAWTKFYPDEPGDFIVDIAEGADDELPHALDVFLVKPDGRVLEVEALSAGQLELFLFLAALVLNDEREGIVFIDEPELHLDPQWHRLFIRTLVELQPRAQFIVATHSPEIYDAARSYERHFLVPEDDPRAWAWQESIRPDPAARG